MTSALEPTGRPWRVDRGGQPDRPGWRSPPTMEARDEWRPIVSLSERAGRITP